MVRVSVGQAFDDRGHEPRHQGLCASDPQLPRRRIGQKLWSLHALLQFIEDRGAAIEQCSPEHRGFDAARTPIEQTHTKRMLQVRDGLRNDRMRNCQILRGFGNAAPFHNREQDVEVPQFDPTTDPVRPSHVVLVVN